MGEGEEVGEEEEEEVETIINNKELLIMRLIQMIIQNTILFLDQV